ncbi:MAG: arsenate reductase family protein [Bacteroidota bacterium]
MNKIYYLSACSTCQKIIKELGINEQNFLIQDIKTTKITLKELDEMKKLSGNYETLFSRVAMKYRSMGLNEMKLGENDYKKYILEEYTFLKRPVMIINGKIFIGNSKKNVEAAKAELKK